MWAPTKATILAALDKGFRLNSKDNNGNLMYPGILALRSAVRNSKPRQTVIQLPTFQSQQLNIIVAKMFQELMMLGEDAQNEAAKLMVECHANVMTASSTTGGCACNLAGMNRPHATKGC